jgi:TetR/AcrR family transcriptional regulator, regulator of mycofactocin system
MKGCKHARVGTVTRRVGRPEATSHADIEAAAFGLFAKYGFEHTTLDMIAAEVGVSRRTLFGYYASKNDIPWGQFDRSLKRFYEILAAMPDDVPLWDAVHRAVRAFNDFPADARPSHLERMRLILGTPALQAHSVLRYVEWRRVIASYVAQRKGTDPDAPLPALVGQLSLALALSAYDEWLADPSQPLLDLIGRQMTLLRGYLALA